MILRGIVLDFSTETGNPTKKTLSIFVFSTTLFQIRIVIEFIFIVLYCLAGLDLVINYVPVSYHRYTVLTVSVCLYDKTSNSTLRQKSIV